MTATVTATPISIGRLGTVLSIWAHPDDETYLAAGVMSAARDLGQRVVCATATAGELGTTDPQRWPPARLAATRRGELAAAMAHLGVIEHRVDDLPDGSLASQEAGGTCWVAGLLHEVRPDTVLTFGPDGMTFHPDHVAVHRWVTAAWIARGRSFRLLYATPTAEHLAHFGQRYEEWGIYMGDERPAGVPERELTLHLRLSGAALDRKMRALQALASQTADAIELLGEHAYREQNAEEGFLDASRALAVV